MDIERLFILCGLSPEGAISASWAALCERCVALDGPQTLRTYRAMAELSPELRACGVGDGCQVVTHHDGVEVRHGPEVDLRKLAFLDWRCRVDYRAATEPGYSWH